MQAQWFSGLQPQSLTKDYIPNGGSLLLSFGRPVPSVSATENK